MAGDRFIKYEVDVETNAEKGLPSATRCNCTFCQKLSTTNLRLDDPSSFRLLSPPSRDEVGEYAPGSTKIHRYFCKTCSVIVWFEGSFEFQGQNYSVFTVNLASVDQPQEGVDLSVLKFKYWDGLHNNFHLGLKDEPWPSGLL